MNKIKISDKEEDIDDIDEDQEVIEIVKKSTRVVTNQDIINYEAMVESYIRDYVLKNWNEASQRRDLDSIALGNTGFTMQDIRQHLRAEVCIALQKYNPDYRTAEGRSVKESTFVFQHLFNRTGQLMKKLTKKRYGYGVRHANLEEVLWETEGKD